MHRNTLRAAVVLFVAILLAPLVGRVALAAEKSGESDKTQQPVQAPTATPATTAPPKLKAAQSSLTDIRSAVEDLEFIESLTDLTGDELTALIDSLLEILGQDFDPADLSEVLTELGLSDADVSGDDMLDALLGVMPGTDNDPNSMGQFAIWDTIKEAWNAVVDAVSDAVDYLFGDDEPDTTNELAAAEIDEEAKKAEELAKIVSDAGTDLGRAGDKGGQESWNVLAQHYRLKAFRLRAIADSLRNSRDLPNETGSPEESAAWRRYLLALNPALEGTEFDRFGRFLTDIENIGKGIDDRVSNPNPEDDTPPADDEPIEPKDPGVVDPPDEVPEAEPTDAQLERLEKTQPGANDFVSYPSPEEDDAAGEGFAPETSEGDGLGIPEPCKFC